MSGRHVKTERSGSALVLSLDRPAARNALDTATLAELRTAMAAGLDDPEVRSVVLSSSDLRVFSAGMDVKEASLPGSDTAERLLDFQWFLETYPKPVLAALSGLVIGGGAELALSADLRIGSPETRISFPATGYGIVQGTWHLLEMIGAARARELVMTGRVVHAQEALEVGLLHEVVANPRARCQELAGVLSLRDESALREVKQLFMEASGRSLRQRFEAELEVNRRLLATGAMKRASARLPVASDPAASGEGGK